MRKLASSVVFSAALLALVGVARPASAGDDKLAGGSLCRQIGTETTGVGAARFAGYQDGLLNATLLKQQVACPLLRDSGDQPFTLLFVRALDTIVGGGATNVPRCKVMGLSADGGSLEESDWEQHSNPSAAGMHEFDSLSLIDDFDPGLNGSASVFCELGAFDTILSLRWEEDSTSISSDTKILPGTACRSLGGFAHGAGWHNAPQGAEVRAECPIVRDNSSAELEGAWVRLDLIGSGVEASCRLRTRSVTGSSFGVSDWEDHTSEDDGSSVFLDGEDMSAHVPQGAYWVECDLPGNGRVLSVRWDEP
jgi:hypothetical protein